jgi:hypothetical protein
MHEKSELGKEIYVNVMTDGGFYSGKAIGISSYEYHPFNEIYKGDLDILICDYDDGVVLEARNKFRITDAPCVCEIVQRIKHYSRKMSNNWWCWPEELNK